MNQRPSLMDQAGISQTPTSPAKQRGGGGGGLGEQPIKLILVGVLLVAAVGVMAWRLGLLPGGKPKVDKDVQAQRQDQFQEQVQEEQKAAATTRQRRTEAGG